MPQPCKMFTRLASRHKQRIPCRVCYTYQVFFLSLIGRGRTLCLLRLIRYYNIYTIVQYKLNADQAQTKKNNGPSCGVTTGEDIYPEMPLPCKMFTRLASRHKPRIPCRVCYTYQLFFLSSIGRGRTLCLIPLIGYYNIYTIIQYKHTNHIRFRRTSAL
jgi:uncharacterized membrane protein YesL